MRADPARKKPLKRHRDGVIATANETLSRKAIDQAIANGDHAAVHKAAVDVLAATTLAGPTRHLKALKDMPSEHAMAFATSLRALLWGKESYLQRFDAFVTVLGAATNGGATWALATALPALVHSDVHVCVHLKTFREQARWMAPGVPPMTTPNGAVYKRYSNMAQSIADRLGSDGLNPQDLVDVHDFVVETLRPAAKQRAWALRGAK